MTVSAPLLENGKPLIEPERRGVEWVLRCLAQDLMSNLVRHNPYHFVRIAIWQYRQDQTPFRKCRTDDPFTTIRYLRATEIRPRFVDPKPDWIVPRDAVVGFEFGDG